MLKKKILGTMVMLALVMFIESFMYSVSAAEYAVGVEPSDWIKYGEISGIPDLVWVRIEVIDVEGTIVTAILTQHFKDGTETNATASVDVATGYGDLTLWVIPANLTKGDSIPLGSLGTITVNDVVTRTYVGASRSVVYANFMGIGLYWDQKTGMLVELSGMGIVIRATETNLWAPKIFLGIGLGWMRIAPQQYVYGEAKLYKIEETQIELVITYQGEEYSRTWEIKRHEEHINHELYFCFSPDHGPLVVRFHRARWTFWRAVGKDAIAFGFSGYIRFLAILEIL